MSADRADVVICGGAVVGCATALFLLREAGPGLRVRVLERDPSYASCATTRSAASIRHQFSTPENIRLSLFGTRFLREPEALAAGGERPDFAFREAGYLFLATEAGRAVLAENHALQRAEGADVAWLDRAALGARFPWLRTEDLAAGTLGLSGEGWLDAHALLHALRRVAIALGARFEAGTVAGLDRAGARIDAVRRADGGRIACGHVVNAAGTGAAALAASAGIELDVRARKRAVFHFRSPEPAPGCPLLIDPCGLYVRPEGAGFIAGIAPPGHEDPDCADGDFEVPHALWDERVWPLLAERVPGFEAARLVSAWAGHYDVHPLDHNAIVGAHPEIQNLWFANGFSGHGLQQAPGVGRALAELIVHGGFRTLDLSALGWARVLAGRPLAERNVV